MRSKLFWFIIYNIIYFESKFEKSVGRSEMLVGQHLNFVTPNDVMIVTDF